MSTTPIPTGAIVEMIFKKKAVSRPLLSSPIPTMINVTPWLPFKKKATATTLNESLTDDSLWGDSVYVPASTPQGDRLVLSYDFANPSNPLNYKDVPSAQALCSAFNACDNAANDDKNRLLAMLSAMQAGHISFSEQIVGVVGEGAYFDGADHLQFPLGLNQNAQGGYSPGDQTLRSPCGFTLKVKNNKIFPQTRKSYSQTMRQTRKTEWA